MNKLFTLSKKLCCFNKAVGFALMGELRERERERDYGPVYGSSQFLSTMISAPCAEELCALPRAHLLCSVHAALRSPVFYEIWSQKQHIFAFSCVLVARAGRRAWELRAIISSASHDACRTQTLQRKQTKLKNVNCERPSPICSPICESIRLSKNYVQKLRDPLICNDALPTVFQHTSLEPKRSYI